MRHTNDLPTAPEVTLTTQGQFPGIEDYVQEKIGGLSRLAHRPVLHARVRLSRIGNPAVANAVLAQANFDVNGRTLRAQVDADSARAAIDLLEARLRGQLEHIAGSPRARHHEGEPKIDPVAFPRRRIKTESFGASRSRSGPARLMKQPRR